jgi:hypothetical protein
VTYLGLLPYDRYRLIGAIIMITEIVLWKTPDGMSRDEIVAKFKSTVPTWQANQNLIHKALSLTRLLGAAVASIFGRTLKPPSKRMGQLSKNV